MGKGCGCFGMILGPFFLIGAVWLLFWNEGHAVKVAQGLGEGSTKVVTIDPHKIDPALDNKLVYVTGKATATAPLVDPLTKLRVKGLFLHRTTEMYQWVESISTQDKVHTYDKDWKSTEQDSASFQQPDGHHNPAFPTDDSGTIAHAVCGAYSIDSSLIAKLPDAAAYKVPRSINLPGGKGVSVPANSKLPGGNLFVPPKNVSLATGWHRTEYGAYKGSNSSSPHIGDLRATFTLVPFETVSIVAKNDHGALTEYASTSGADIALISPGTVSAAALFHQAQQLNMVEMWGLRVVGFVVMLIGFLGLTSPISSIARNIPFIGALVGDVDFLVSAALAAITTAITVAVGWASARPILSVLLIAGVVVVVAFLVKRHSGRPTPVSP